MEFSTVENLTKSSECFKILSKSSPMCRCSSTVGSTHLHSGKVFPLWDLHICTVRKCFHCGKDVFPLWAQCSIVGITVSTVVHSVPLWRGWNYLTPPLGGGSSNVLDQNRGVPMLLKNPYSLQKASLWFVHTCVLLQVCQYFHLFQYISFLSKII